MNGHQEPKGQEIAVVNESTALLSVIERVAMSPDADITKLEKMLDLQERILDRNAKQAYMSAFADMQAELPEISQEGEIKHSGKLISTYALFEDINEAVKPILQKHGFGISFRVKQDGELIRIAGILSHREGHSEETEMALPADISGAKNKVQAIGSSVTYGKRYVLCALLNITTRGEDDDAEKTGPKLQGKNDPNALPIPRDARGEIRWDDYRQELELGLNDLSTDEEFVDFWKANKYGISKMQRDCPAEDRIWRNKYAHERRKLVDGEIQ